MLILAIDSAAHLCSAAVLDGRSGEIVGSREEDIGRGHAERMMAVIDGALGEGGIALDAIGRIAVTVGPGSFTGIRVGVATARGLALALDVPAVGVTTLAALAAGIGAARHGEHPLMVLVDARRGEVYAQLFGARAEPLSAPAAMTVAEAAEAARLRGAVLAGSGAALVAEAAGDALTVLDTRAAPEIGVVARLGSTIGPGTPPAPLYLRAPDARTQHGFALKRQDEARR